MRKIDTILRKKSDVIEKDRGVYLERERIYLCKIESVCGYIEKVVEELERQRKMENVF
jgi:hypothetical protein